MREQEREHLTLCNELYWHQVCAGRHFHLEQPQGSELMKQSEVYDVALGTMPASFDQCRVGGLRLPQDDRFLRKRTIVNITSRHMRSKLHRRWCRHDHEHRRIEGSFAYKGDRHQVSAYAAHYTQVFAKTVAKAMLETCSMKEDPLIVAELWAGFEASTEHKRSRESREIVMDSLRLKRRRCDFKQPCPAAFAPVEPPLSWQEASKITPRVGVRNFWEGDFFQKVQQALPEMKVQLVVTCRGTDRFRTPSKDEDVRDLSLRKTVYVHRVSGEVIDVGDPEEWKKLSRLRRIGKSLPDYLWKTFSVH